MLIDGHAQMLSFTRPHGNKLAMYKRRNNMTHFQLQQKRIHMAQVSQKCLNIHFRGLTKRKTGELVPASKRPEIRKPQKWPSATFDSHSSSLLLKAVLLAYEVGMYMLQNISKSTCPNKERCETPHKIFAFLVLRHCSPDQLTK